MNTLPNPTNLVTTQGVLALRGIGFNSPEDDYLFAPALAKAVQTAFNAEPDECTDGGNDKHFFSFTFRGTKLFAAENEVGGLTIMLPEEY
jgi:hypothetical protein